jgi:Apea-like HEPN
MNNPIAPIATVTPLYHFSSRSPELSLDKGTHISKYDPAVLFDEVLSRHLQVYEPEFLLWHDPLILGQVSGRELLELAKKEDESLTLRFTNPVLNLLLALRVFKPGYLRAGATFVISRKSDDAPWTTLSSTRASLMVVDYGILGMQSTSYVLESEEIPFFVAFTHGIFPVMNNLDLYLALSQALSLYSADNGEYLNAVGNITALEALLTKKEETEGLTYRLALRIANLLGNDANSRKSIFRQVKDFYSLRSKIVHGVTLDKKLRERLTAIDSLREMVRRVLLSTMALYSQGTLPADLPDLLDETALDDESRERIWTIASKFLHLSAETVPATPAT